MKELNLYDTSDTKLQIRIVYYDNSKIISFRQFWEVNRGFRGRKFNFTATDMGDIKHNLGL